MFRLEGWRLAMLVVGLPLALLLGTTMREAPRNNKQAVVPPIGALLVMMKANFAAFFTIFIGYGSI